MAKAAPPQTPAKQNHRDKLPGFSAEVVGGIVTVALAAFFFIWRLSTLTNGKLNYHEHLLNQTLLNQKVWWKSILNINGPYYLVLHLSRLISPNLYMFRSVSVLIGILTALGVYWLISQWHGYRIALLSAAVYLTSFGVLSISRQADPISLSLLIPLELLIAIVIIYRWQNLWGLLAVILAAGNLLYIPGALWLVIAANILSLPKIKEAWKTLSTVKKIVLLLIFLSLIAPLGYRLGTHYSNHQLAYWLGYGLNGKIEALKTYGFNLIHAPANLFFYSTNLPAASSLGHLPLVPISITILAILGLYSYLARLNNYRWRSVIFLFVLTWLVIGFGVLPVYTLLPLTAIATGTGLAYMLSQWYKVFPKNPVARYGGIALMMLIVAFSCFFSVRSYFVAWSNDPATTNNYSYKLLINISQAH
jgi:4-amino-4-deoxy-L-arabinose transferase-like glycosyltransferase